MTISNKIAQKDSNRMMLTFVRYIFKVITIKLIISGNFPKCVLCLFPKIGIIIKYTFFHCLLLITFFGVLKRKGVKRIRRCFTHRSYLLFERNSHIAWTTLSGYRLWTTQIFHPTNLQHFL